MPFAAVPNYLGQEYSSASPGDRFTMFLPLWGKNRRSGALLWTTHDVGYEVRGQNRQEREVRYESKSDAINAALPLTNDDRARMEAIAKRQSAFVMPEILFLPAISTAPFATGLGIEHPLENGFAFLNPYGLPYLPGSSVKGVLRKAAQELSEGLFGASGGWMPEIIEALFGCESEDRETGHQRGALTFWDVIPQVKGDKLVVEIMTPHQSHYLQGRESPHDSGSPNPISFLAVPAGSDFAFHVQCNRPFLQRLAPTLIAADPANDPWRELLGTAFEHSYQWLGFGAKTAVGYGAMRGSRSNSAADTRPPKWPHPTNTPTTPKPPEPAPEIWNNAEVILDPGSGRLSCVFSGKTASATGNAAQDLRKKLPTELQDKLKKHKKGRFCATVEPVGNAWAIVKLEPAVP